MPEEWAIGTPTDNTSAYPRASQWYSQGVPATAQDVQTLDQAAWLSANHGSVDMGLSPVLSHEGQSTHTFNSLSEPDACILPPSLDLSFASEPQWHGPIVYTSPDGTPLSGHEYGFTSIHDGMGHPVSCPPAPQVIYPGAYPVFFPQGGQAALPRPAFAYAPAFPMRPILPRAEGTGYQSPPAYGSHRAIQPQTQGSRSHVPSVSNMAGQPLEAQRHDDGVARRSTRSPMSSHPAYGTASCTSSPVQASVSAPSDVGSYIKPEISLINFADPTADDFGAFINYDHGDHLPSSDTLRSEQQHMCRMCRVTDALDSYAPGYESLSSVPSSISGDVKASQPEQESKAGYQTTSVSASLSSESEEGRHRNHPLYNQGPRSDGLYHCPYKAQDPNCPHRPTKLKCNYEYGPQSFPMFRLVYHVLTTCVLAANTSILT